MATITVNIDVNDEQFKDMCVNNINELPKEKVEEILLKAVETALMNDTASTRQYGDSASILVQKVNSTYSSSYEPTKLLREVMGKIDTDKYINPIADMIGRYIKDNYKTLIAEYMTNEIAKLLFSNENRYSLERCIFDGVQSMLSRG